MQTFSNQSDSIHSNKNAELALRENVCGNQMHHRGQANQDRRIVGRNFWRGERRQIFCEKAIHHAGGDEKKQVFTQPQPQEQTKAQQKPALDFGQRERGLASIKNPHGNQVENVQSRGGAGKRGPHAIAGSMPKIQASHRAEKSRERSCKTDDRTRDSRDAQRSPFDVGSQTRQKNRHFGGKSSAPDFQVVPHLVNKNKRNETNSEPGAVERPVQAHEGEQRKEEFEFEEGQQQKFAL